MKIILVLALLSLGTFSLFNFIKISNGQSQTSNCKCVFDALSEIKKIKIGMKRKDLNKIFSFDGGVSAPNPQRFVYNQCNFVKVEVKFNFVEKNERFPKDNLEDEITEISKPYLEDPFYD